MKKTQTVTLDKDNWVQVLGILQRANTTPTSLRLETTIKKIKGVIDNEETNETAG